MSTDTGADLPPGIGAPATRALAAAGYSRLSDLAGVPRAELAKLHGVGPKALRIIEAALGRDSKSLGGPGTSIDTDATEVERDEL